MKPILSLLVAGALFAQAPMTDQRIIELVKSGIQPGELLRLIQTAPLVSFDLSPTGTDNMVKAGVTQDTIKAMSAREQGINYSTAPVAAQPQPLVSQPARHAHRTRTWILVGVTAGGLAYLGYALSNPHAGGLGCPNCNSH